MSNYSQKGDIEDAINHVKSKFPGDRAMQSKGVKVCIDLIKRDYDVQTIRGTYSKYDVELTAFPSSGMVYSYWELYDNGSFVANGVERMDTNYKNSILLFSSNSSFSRPIVLTMIGK